MKYTANLPVCNTYPGALYSSEVLWVGLTRCVFILCLDGVNPTHLRSGLGNGGGGVSITNYELRVGMEVVG